MADHNKYKQLLRSRREELTILLNSIEDKLDQPMNPDFSERAVEREDDEVLESTGKNGAYEIEAIDAALARIASGTYGQCINCESAISSERLSSVPTAFKCRKCA